jgi:type IV secretory pathway VirB3-like protein
MAIVTMATVIVIIEATTANATLITPVLHTANPVANMRNLMANPEIITASQTNITANPKLAKVIPLMVIPRSFPG